MNTYNDTTTADAVRREALAAEQARAAQHKRDRFEAAKAAMQGLLALPEDFDGDSLAEMQESCARVSVGYADALLAELSKWTTG